MWRCFRSIKYSTNCAYGSGEESKTFSKRRQFLSGAF